MDRMYRMERRAETRGRGKGENGNPRRILVRFWGLASGIYRMEARMDDVSLLKGYVDRQDQGALGELVGRHGAWLHSAARRQMGDEHRAEDLTQAVFMMLMKRAWGLHR